MVGLVLSLMLRPSESPFAAAAVSSSAAAAVSSAAAAAAVSSAAAAAAIVSCACFALVQCLADALFLQRHGAELQRAYLGVQSFLALGKRQLSPHSR